MGITHDRKQILAKRGTKVTAQRQTDMQHNSLVPRYNTEAVFNSLKKIGEPGDEATVTVPYKTDTIGAKDIVLSSEVSA